MRKLSTGFVFSNIAILVTVLLTLNMFAIFPFPNSPVAMAAPLRNVIVNPTNNIVNTIATYEITFMTGTTGTIKSLQIDFPVFTDISSSKLIERTGIGRGSYGRYRVCPTM